MYEKVRVRSRDPRKSQVNGQDGAVVGQTPTEDGVSWYYSVHMYSDNLGWCFYEDELESLGQFAKREEFYDGTSLRVRVDEHGHGSLAGDEE